MTERATDRLCRGAPADKQPCRLPPGDRIALVVFADHAYLLSLTQETGALLTLARELDFDLAGAPRPWEAILLARQHADPTRPTAPAAGDGRAQYLGQCGSLTEARLAAKAGIRLYTLGWAPTLTPSPRLAGDADPSAELDEALLQQLATLGGGSLFSRPQPGRSCCHQPGHRHPGALARLPDLSWPHQELSTSGHWPWPGCCSAGQPAGAACCHTGHPMNRQAMMVAPWS